MATIRQEYRKAVSQLESQAEQARQQVASEAEEVRKPLHERRGTIEEELQSQLGIIRTAEREEQRKRDLPITAPRDIATKEKLEAVQTQAQSYTQEIKDLLAKVKTSEAEALTDIEKQTKEGQEKLAQWRKDAERAYQQAVAEAKAKFESTHVELNTGEWVDKDKFHSMDMESQVSLMKLGTKRFNQKIKDDWAEFEATHVETSIEGEWINKVEFDKLDTLSQNYLKTHGLDAFNTWAEGSVYREVAARIAQQTGVRYQDVLSSVKANPGEYGINIIVETARALSEKTGVRYQDILASIKAQPGEYGILFREAITAKAKEIAEATGMSYTAILKSVEEHPEEYGLLGKKPTTIVTPEMVTIVGMEGGSWSRLKQSMEAFFHEPGFIKNELLLSLGEVRALRGKEPYRDYLSGLALSILEGASGLALSVFEGASMALMAPALLQEVFTTKPEEDKRGDWAASWAVTSALLLEYKEGMVQFFKKEIPELWRDDPVYAVGLLMGMVGGVEGVVRIGRVTKGIKISSSGAIATAEGAVTSWKGLSIFNNPVIGVSKGKLVIGARSITIPEARLILDGYKPEMMLETKVFANPRVLARAGFTKPQIDYLILTLKDRNLFAGKKSPFLSKEALIQPTARLDASEISVLLGQISKHQKNIKQADLLYGSPTVKAQLAPELRGWRKVHDWDIQTTFGETATNAFAKETLGQLRGLRGKGQYMIDPKSPNHILKKIDGKWEGMVDIHSREVVSVPKAEIPASKLDATGTYSYGRMVAEPAITVKYPELGIEISIMRLSESGVRKADTILRVRQTPEGTKFTPPERGIAKPGVPKDAADFYVILRTLLGEKVANKWARAWAEAMGYSKAELPRVMPSLLETMAMVAKETPSNLIGYRIRSIGVSKASPTFTIHVPSSLGASVSASMERTISTPISPYASLAALRKYVASVSPGIVKSDVVSAATYRIDKSGKPSVSPSLASVKPSPTPSPVPSPKPSPKPSPVPSPTPTPTPSLAPPSISLPPSYPPLPPSVPPGKPVIVRLPDGTSRALTKKEAAGIIAWKQGFIYKLIFPPFGKANIIHSRAPIAGVKYYSGLGSAARSIIAKRTVPPQVLRDMGIMDLQIITPLTGKPRIHFRRDVKQRTRVTPRAGISGIRK